MSSYHSSFGYLGKRSDNKEFGWIISHFDGDSGESDTFLSTDSVFSDSYDGTRRTIYGTKYNSVATPQITVIKQDGSNFTVEEIRNALKWLTGTKQSSWMDFYIGNEDEPKYRMLGHIQDVKQYKQDARTIGLIIYFESVSPWAYSSLQTELRALPTSDTIDIENKSDDLYSYTNVRIEYHNTSGDSLTITNEQTGKTTIVNNLVENEKITITDNMMILSDSPEQTFSNRFNFVFPQLVAGINKLKVTGTGNITFEYTYPIKIGDLAIDINTVSDPICNEDGNIVIDTLPWARISDIPTTLSGHNINNAYTKLEVDEKIANITNVSVSWSQITHKPDIYTKEEIDNEIGNAINELQIDEEVLLNMLSETLI